MLARPPGRSSALKGVLDGESIHSEAVKEHRIAEWRRVERIRKRVPCSETNHARANDGDANRVKPRIVSIELTRMRDAALAVDSFVIDLCK